MENILRRFFRFDQLEEVRPFGNGHINDTYRAALRQNGISKKYLLQRFNTAVFTAPDAVMQNIAKVAAHLSAKEYPLLVLKPYTTEDGAFLAQDEMGYQWRVFDFFENTCSFDKVETNDQAFEAAKAYGIFANALGGLAPRSLNMTIPGFHDGQKRLNDFFTAAQKGLPDRLEGAWIEVAEVKRYSEWFKKIQRLKLPLRAIHHDTKINNVLFGTATKKAVAVVDLDTIMPGRILSDFGDMVRTFTNAADEDEPDFSKVEMRPAIYEALKEGFLSEMGDLLSPAELANLKYAGPWLTLMQAARFLTDHLQGDIYYKTKYPGHNLVRAKNQLALFRSMRQQQQAMG